MDFVQSICGLCVLCGACTVGFGWCSIRGCVNDGYQFQLRSVLCYRTICMSILNMQSLFDHGIAHAFSQLALGSS